MIRIPAFLLLTGVLHLTALAAAALGLVTWWCALLAVIPSHLLIAFGSLWPRSRLLGPSLLRVSKSGPGQVYLTFDDGPDPRVTPVILDTLRHHEARASFFCIGEKVLAHPEIVRRMVAEGHTVENHSHRHSRAFSLFGPARANREITRAQDAIATQAGIAPRYFRAPAGLRGPWLGILLPRHGLHLVVWTRRGFDTLRLRPETVHRRLVRGLRPGDILVLHDGGSAPTPSGKPLSCVVLPGLLEHLARHGLSAAKLPDPGQAVE